MKGLTPCFEVGRDFGCSEGEDSIESLWLELGCCSFLELEVT